MVHELIGNDKYIPEIISCHYKVTGVRTLVVKPFLSFNSFKNIQKLVNFQDGHTVDASEIPKFSTCYVSPGMQKMGDMLHILLVTGAAAVHLYRINAPKPLDCCLFQGQKVWIEHTSQSLTFWQNLQDAGVCL